MAIESLAVSGVGVRLAGIGRGIEPAVLGELRLRKSLERSWIGVEEGRFAIVCLPKVFALVEGILGG